MPPRDQRRTRVESVPGPTRAGADGRLRPSARSAPADERMSWSRAGSVSRNGSGPGLLAELSAWNFSCLDGPVPLVWPDTDATCTKREPSLSTCLKNLRCDAPCREEHLRACEDRNVPLRTLDVRQIRRVSGEGEGTRMKSNAVIVARIAPEGETSWRKGLGPDHRLAAPRTRCRQAKACPMIHRLCQMCRFSWSATTASPPPFLLSVAGVACACR